MSELQAAHPIGPESGSASVPEIGDVLASIRRLIAQEDGGPDFAQPVRRMDASGKARSALPLGPKAERIRSVIERELGAIDLADERLILRDDIRLPHVDPPGRAAGWTDDLPAPLPSPETGFDEAAYQQARMSGLGRIDGPAGQITAIPPQMGAAPASANTAQETDMMLAEISRAELREDPMALRAEPGFDLFANDISEDEDQLAGGNALRNLVRDVIRQELQGEMGDRISRNLRRAIRQEVAAAIEAGLKTA